METKPTYKDLTSNFTSTTDQLMDYNDSKFEPTEIEDELINLTLEEKHRIYTPWQLSSKSTWGKPHSSIPKNKIKRPMEAPGASMPN